MGNLSYKVEVRARKYKAFVAHSFDEKDKEVVDWIINKLKKCFDVVTGEQPEAKRLVEKIFPKIDKCDVFCCILTKRYCNDKGEWVASPWIYGEMDYANFNKKKILVFVEEGIKDLGITSKDYEYVSFNREKMKIKENIQKLKKKIEDYASSLYKEAMIQPVYEVIENISRISIYNDGHGIEDVEVTLNTLSDNFEKKLHDLWLEECANKNINLISLREKLKNLDLSYACRKRFSEQTFYARVLEPESIYISDVEIIDKDTTKDKISFNLVFKSLDRKPIPANTRIKYAWGWSSPKAFPFKKEQLNDRSLKKKVAYACYTWKTTCEYDLIIIINFENGYKIKEYPFIEVYDRDEQFIQRKYCSELEKKLYYTTYYFRMGKVKPYFKFVVKWKPG